jgi:Plasmid pRiA4b ORF-3-like protein
MARTWLSVRVELVGGRGLDLWPRPGRIFAAARSHTFAQLAHVIDVAFARWDLAHMHMFTLADGTEVTTQAHWDGDAPDGSIDSPTTKLGRLSPGDQFAYVFDFGDDWTHLCTIDEQKIDPLDTAGFRPTTPTAYWGWGTLPDQYDRAWDGDDGETPPPKRPTRPLADLPPILPGWGPRRR